MRTASSLLVLLGAVGSWLVCVSPVEVPCIPVMGFGVQQDANNFTERLITHIDHCVDNFVLVLPKLKEEKCRSVSCTPPFRERVLSWVNRQYVNNVTIIEIPHTLIGVAETWNLILTSFKAPWYAICAYDITFMPGQLREFTRRFWMESGLLYSKDNSRVNFAHTKGLQFFALSQEVVAAVGLFDENIFPAFWEDRDYQLRLKLWGGARIKTFKSIRLWHGVDTAVMNDNHTHYDDELESTEYNQKGKLTHDAFLDSHARNSSSDEGRSRRAQYNYTSGTVYLGQPWVRTMQLASKQNMDYLMRKWNCNITLCLKLHHLLRCRYVQPFNDPTLGLSFWQLNSSAIRNVREFYWNATEFNFSQYDNTELSSISNYYGGTPLPRRKSKYSFQDIKRIHHARRKKVIMASKGDT